jgi:hypothetical protein
MAGAAQPGKLADRTETETGTFSRQRLDVMNDAAVRGWVGAGVATGSAEYEEVLRCLSSLIKQKVRADTGNRGNQWDLMAKYLQVVFLSRGACSTGLWFA